MRFYGLPDFDYYLLNQQNEIRFMKRIIVTVAWITAVTLINFVFMLSELNIIAEAYRKEVVLNETIVFDELSLKQLGLSYIESDAFIMFWLPELEINEYNVITFQKDPYERAVSMDITPKPDTVIRVNMLWYPSICYVDMEPQDLIALNPSEREGFTVVE